VFVGEGLCAALKIGSAAHLILLQAHVLFFHLILTLGRNTY